MSLRTANVLVTWPPRRLSIAKGKTIVAELQREQSGNRLFPCDFSLVERSRPHDPIQPNVRRLSKTR